MLPPLDYSIISSVKLMEIIKEHKNDILLILAVLILAGGIWLYTFLSRETGAEVVVSVAGEELCRMPLSEDTEKLIGEGETTNLLVISDGKAAITEATCPDHVCVNTGEISFNGQTIVCLPHKLVVGIEGGTESELDGIAG